MATREEYDFLSENERKFLFDSIHDKPHVRADGRDLMQQRKIRVQFRRSDDQSQAEVQLGRTRVIANVHGEIVPPFPDRPTEGFLQFNVELSPMASQNFENTSGSRATPLAVELARIVDRGIRECRALDTEALAIVAGEKVWAITCDIHVVDHGGNLIDCVSLAAIASLMHFRRPEVSVQGGSGGGGGGATTTVYKMDDHAAVPLSLHHLPISISFCLLQKKETEDAQGDQEEDNNNLVIFMDPTDREERITDGSMTFTFNSFRELCAVHKMGGAPISQKQILRCAQIAVARVSEMTEFLKKEEQKADEIARTKRRTLLRGQDFEAQKSSLNEQITETHRQQVDLGIMTDYKTLHAPIALRDDPSAKEEDAKNKSMASLLATLELAADTTTTTDTGGGMAVDGEAREAFMKLAAGFNVRELVAGAAGATPSAKKNKSKKRVESDSDSEEESVVVLQKSEFKETPAAVAVAAKPVVANKKTATKKKAAVSSDSEEEVDLSAAIKRKGGKAKK